MNDDNLWGTPPPEEPAAEADAPAEEDGTRDVVLTIGAPNNVDAVEVFVEVDGPDGPEERCYRIERAGTPVSPDVAGTLRDKALAAGVALNTKG